MSESRNTYFTFPGGMMRNILFSSAMMLIALPVWAQSQPDRSQLSLQEALAGHWYMKRYDKNEYYAVVVRSSAAGAKMYGSVNMTWDTGDGKEVSKGVIVESFYDVFEAENSLILTYKSAGDSFT